MTDECFGPCIDCFGGRGLDCFGGRGCPPPPPPEPPPPGGPCCGFEPPAASLTAEVSASPDGCYTVDPITLEFEPTSGNPLIWQGNSDPELCATTGLALSVTLFCTKLGDEGFWLLSLEGCAAGGAGVPPDTESCDPLNLTFTIDASITCDDPAGIPTTLNVTVS